MYLVTLMQQPTCRLILCLDGAVVLYNQDRESCTIPSFHSQLPCWGSPRLPAARLQGHIYGGATAVGFGAPRRLGAQSIARRNEHRRCYYHDA
jgi:hypothetical protein